MQDAARRLDYVFDERAEGRMTGPEGDGLIPRDYTWYARDGVFVRSPIASPASRSERRSVGRMKPFGWKRAAAADTPLLGP